MKRKPHWKQECPRDQVFALLSSIEDDVDKLAHGLGRPKWTGPRIMAAIEEIRGLIKGAMKKGTWDDETDEGRNNRR